MGCTAIPQIVSIHTCDDHVSQTQCRNGFGQIVWLLKIQWIWSSMSNIAEWAAPGAFIAHDHEGGCPLSKAFRHIGTGRLFTNGVQPVFAQNVFDFKKPRIWRCCFHPDPIGLGQFFTRNDFDGDAICFGSSPAFEQRIVGGLRHQCVRRHVLVPSNSSMQCATQLGLHSSSFAF